MRLLNAETLELEDVSHDGERPEYAILSHTWGTAGSEIAFEDIVNLNDQVKAKPGFAKIQHTCRQAVADGYRYAWIDTCMFIRPL